jgi:hypothetical protein
VKLVVASNVGDSPSALRVAASATQQSPPGLISSVVPTIPDANGNVTLTITPAANMPSAYQASSSAPFWPVGVNGTAQINVTVTDGSNPATTISFPVTVTYINQGPTIVGLENTNTVANGGPFTFSFGLADVDTPVSQLEAGILNATNSQISFSAKNGTGFITVIPNSVVGTDTIVVTNYDPISSQTVTQSVTVALQAPTPPTLAPIANMSVLPGANVPITLNITPGTTPLSGLAVSYSWTPANDATVIISPSQTTAILTPIPGFLGTLSVTASVSDHITTVSQTFQITFALPTPPTIAAILPQTVQASQLGRVALTIQPGQPSGVPLSALTVTAASANNNIATASVSGNAFVIITGVQPGTANVTVAVSDGYNTPVTQTFAVTVVAPTPPVWGPLTNEIVTALNTPVTITLPVTNGVIPLSNLVFSATIKTQVVSSVLFTNNGTTVTATFVPVNNAIGSETDTLNMFDGFTTVPILIEVVVTDLPMVQLIGPQTVAENGTLSLSFKVASSVGNPLTKIVVTPTVSQENPPGLVSSGKLVASSPDSNGVVTLSLVPGANLPSAYPGSAPFWPVGTNGTALVTLSVTDGQFVNATTFPLTVSYVNQAPTIVGLVSATNTTPNAPLTIQFTAADVDTPASELEVGIQSVVNNTGAGVFLTSKGNTQLLTLIPYGVAGTASVTITNYDPLSQMTATGSVTFTITAEVPPTFAAIPSVSTAENTPVVVPLAITSTVTPLTNLTFSYQVSNPKLVSSVIITVDRFPVDGYTATADVIPVNDQAGTCVITISVSDGIAVVSQPLVLTVVPTPPTFAPIADVTTPKNTPVTVPLVVTPTVTPLSGLTFSYKVSNSNLISSILIYTNRFVVNGATATADIIPANNQYGISLVTITVSDAFSSVSQPFAVQVLPAPPSLAPLPAVVAIEGSPVTVPLNVTSPDTPLSQLGFVGSSTNTALVSGVTFAATTNSTTTNVTATVNLVPNQTGTATIVIQVSDGYSTNSQSFALTVSPSSSAAATLSATLVGKVLKVTFTGAPNSSYVVQVSSDFKTWTQVGAAITTDSNGKGEYDATVSSSGDQYFRVVFE